jgi:flagellin
MSRINTNISSMVAQNNLAESQRDMQVRLERLSTGLRINRGADDPAGLIISERLRSEIQGADQAIDNAERASNVIATGEAALSEVSDLLNTIKSLTVEAANTAGLSEEEIEANQLQIDSAVESINRIADTTSFGGLKLLNGSLDYITSGVANSAISQVDIHSANFGTNETLPVNVDVVSSAQKGNLFLSTGGSGLPSAVTFDVAGSKGVETLQLGSGTPLSAVAFAVNRSSDATGVTAQLTSGAGGAGTSAVQFQSTEYGSDAFVSVEKIPGSGGDFFQTFDALGGSAAKRDTGEDVLARVNGNLALGQGTTVQLRSSALQLEMDLSEAFATDPTAGLKEFTITGGGANFQLGPTVDSQNQKGVGVQSVAPSRLGNAEDGFLSSIVSGGENALINGKAREASQIIETAISQVSVMRGRLGAFERNTLQPNVRSLQIAVENLTASESRIRDADFAKETSKLTRAQVLTNAGTSVLSTANNTAQNVLSLLQQ